jgi:hypothetical protein
MPDPSPSAVAPPSVRDDALRIVLFGMPDAGKSSLLGALAQAAQTQEHILNGHLSDLSGGLGELQRRLYEERPRETLEEVVPYPIRFEPFSADGSRGRPQFEAVLVDCDGRVANELLSRRRSLDGTASPDGSLAGAILEADTLVLVVDASASATQVDADFGEFGRFLRLLEQNRGRRTEVGGLPVFLVLTKCDLLAQAQDGPADWMERIEERKRQVDQRFQAFLARQGAQGPVPFGRIDLHLWATAVKRPALTGSPARPRDPYGVAELFRQCVDSARGFRQRREHSGRRLRWTMAGAGAVVAGMVALMAGLLANREIALHSARPPALQAKVDNFLARVGQTPSARLREPLQRNLSELTDLVNDPEFDRLAPEKQEEVRQLLQEMTAYRTYKDELLKSRAPAEARSDEELADIEKRLNGELALPEAYRAEWGQTEAALLRARRLEDIKALQAAVGRVEDWYRDLKRRGQALWTFSDRSGREGAPVAWNDWQGRVDRLLDEARTPPFRPTDSLPGASAVTYATVFQFDRIIDARQQWDQLRQRLEDLRDLSAALGLTGPSPGRPPLLKIPSSFPIDQAVGRLQELKTTYPRFAEWAAADILSKWVAAGLPNAVAAELRQAAEVSYQNLIRTGQERVLRQLQQVSPDGQETPARWREVRAWLVSTTELADWDRLAVLLARLGDAKADDPVAALVAFLGQDRFELTFHSVTVSIPDDLRVRPAGRLTIHYGSGNETLVCKRSGDDRRDPDRRATVYTFVPEGTRSIVYRPGDKLWAELPLKDRTDRDLMFTWSRSRSLDFQFERLLRPPRLHRPDQENTAGDLKPDVQLRVMPERGVPRLPDLLPVVQLQKR